MTPQRASRRRILSLSSSMGADLPKSLSHKPPHDENGGELHEGEVVLRLLLPPDEQLAEAVEPRVRAFDHPPSRPLAAPTVPALLAAATNVRQEAAPADRLLSVGVIVALVEAEMLLGVRRRANDPRVEQLSQRGLVRRIGGGD